MTSYFQFLQPDDLVLLVEPEYPHKKSRNHSNFLPIGLLKIAGYLRTKNIRVKLVRHGSEPHHTSEYPKLILVTSLFTYWSKYVKDAVTYYKQAYPDVPVYVGGVYASLLPDHCKEYTKCDLVISGIIPEAEIVPPAYDLVDLDYQILHTMRGCIRRCNFCGVYKVEPEAYYKKSIQKEVCKPKLVFYDNNILANPYIHDILDELILLRHEKKVKYVESQSGFDGRLLLDDTSLAWKIRQAGFKHPYIAWDHGISDAPFIRKQIDLLVDAGYKAKEIGVFMIYNYNIPYNEMEEKRSKCFQYGVQVNDCRYRPLDSTSDGYNPHKRRQKNTEYYIHNGWTDYQVRSFRRNCRRHNICIRSQTDFHSPLIEYKKIPREEIRRYKKMTYKEVKKEIECWSPSKAHHIPGGTKKHD